jgi:hypothetical protein
MELKIFQLLLFYMKKNPSFFNFNNTKNFIYSNLPEDWKSGVFELFSYAESLGCGILNGLHQHLPITCQVAGLVVTHVAYHYMTYFKLLDLVLKAMHYYAHVTPSTLAVFGIGAAILTGQWPVSFDLLTCKPLNLSSDWLYKLTEDLGELPRLPEKFVFLYEKEGDPKAISLAYFLPEFQKQSNLSVFTEEDYNKFRSFKLTCKESDLAFLDDLDISSLDTPILTKNSDTTKNNSILISLGVSTLFFLVAFASGGKGV